MSKDKWIVEEAMSLFRHIIAYETFPLNGHQCEQLAEKIKELYDIVGEYVEDIN